MGFWEPLFFWIFAIGALGASLSVLVFRSPLYSALALIADFFCFAGLYVLLSAHFLAVTQVLVYTGAIMVLFVFIIMLLNLSDEELGARRFNLHHLLALGAGGAALLFMLGSIGGLIDDQKVEVNRKAGDAGVAVQQTAGQMATAIARQQRKAAIEEASGADKRKLKRSARPREPRPDRYVKTPSPVPGLYSDISEFAVRTDYRDELRRYAAGSKTPATNKYRPYDPDRPFVVPPALEQGSKALDEGVRRRQERAQGNLFGTVEPISILLVNRFVIPFELTAVLLLAAIFGAVVIAKKRL
jgi:NADH:ubiquinone oxidoreductase subunit 6 (subunit J)